MTITVPADLGVDERHELGRALFRSDPSITAWGVRDEGLWYELTAESALSPASLESSATERIQAMAGFPTRTLHDLRSNPRPRLENIDELLCQHGYLTAVAPGALAMRGPAALLAERIDRWFANWARDQGAGAWRFPSLLKSSDLERSGYLRDFPHQANLVCHLPGQAGEIREAAARAAAGETVDTPHGLALAPTVCYRLLIALADTTLEEPLLLATANCPCYRYEGPGATQLDRLREFSMREIVGVGAPDQVLAFRDLLLEGTRSFVDAARLHGWIESASDPFFQDVWRQGRTFQLGFDLKTEARVAVAGRDESLAIASVNYHRDHFGLAFNITASSGEPVHSCCVGFGIERWVLAVMSHHGIDPAGWPDFLTGDD